MKLLVLICLLSLRLSVCFVTLSPASILQHSSSGNFLLHSSTNENSDKIVIQQDQSNNTPIDSMKGLDDAKSPPKLKARVLWKASASARKKVRTDDKILRPVDDYLALPPEQYSLLDAGTVTRLTESEFQVKLPSIKFFGIVVEPILYATVDVEPDKAMSTITINRAEVDGSDIVKRQNDLGMGVMARNIVSMERGEGRDDGKVYLKSNVNMELDIPVPESVWIPTGAIQSTGQAVMQATTNLLVPSFVSMLRKDYHKWAEGDNSRAPVGEPGEALFEK